MKSKIRVCLAISVVSLAWAGCEDSGEKSFTTTVDESDAPTESLRPRDTETPLDTGNSAPGLSEGGVGTASTSGPAAGQSFDEPSDLLQPAEPGDEYDAPGTHPFVMVAHDPLSTFAADVDTASYDLFRRDVEDGLLPQPASVRLEEYVNYFRYDYPAPAADAEVPFDVHLAAAANSLAGSTTLLRVGISGKLPPPEQERAANLVFLVDVSGSMGGDGKLDLARQVLRQTLDLLAPTDTVSIVTYASNTEMRLTPTAAAERDTIIAEIDELVAGGSTNGAGGIQLAYEQAAAGFIEGGINHVVLCTDGDFNVGVSSTAELVELIKDKRRTGVTFTALGFGRGNLDDAMLEAVSNAGNGFYGVISSQEQAAEYVSERMLSTLTLIARDMKIQVEFNADRVVAYRLLGYENRALLDDQFRDDIVDAGEIGAGHQVTALYELVLSGAEMPVVAGAPAAKSGAAYAGPREVLPEDLVLVKVRYKNIDASETDLAFEVSRGLAPDAILPSIEAADPDLAWAVSVAAFSEILKGSPYARREQLDAIAAVITAQAERDEERDEFARLFAAASNLLPAE